MRGSCVWRIQVLRDWVGIILCGVMEMVNCANDYGKKSNYIGIGATASSVISLFWIHLWEGNITLLRFKMYTHKLLILLIISFNWRKKCVFFFWISVSLLLNRSLNITYCWWKFSHRMNFFIHCIEYTEYILGDRFLNPSNSH